MFFVEPTDDDLSLAEATRLTGYGSDKTLRRAVQTGELPRRYVLTARGPMLVFRRGDVERWLAEHTRYRRAVAPMPAPTVVHAGVLDAVRQLAASLTASRTAMAGMLRQLEQHQQQLASTKATIDGLMAQLAFAEAAADKGASEPTDDEAALTVMTSARRSA